MKRRRHQQPLLVVLLAFGLTLSPQSWRLRARGLVLGTLARVARLVAAPAEAANQNTPSDDAVASDREADLQRELARVKSDNDRLREALEQAGAVPEILRGQEALSLVPVHASPMTAGTSISRRLLLTEGSNLGIDRGQAAVVGNALVGIVVEVAPRAAQVRLVTDPAFRIRAVVQGTEIEGLVTGRAGRLLCFEAPPGKDARRAPITVGQVITSSPRSSVCPVPSVLGRVVEVENFGSLTRAFLLPAVDGRGLQSVVVLRTDKARLVKRERKA